MSELTISSERLTAFAAYLRAEERSAGTIENYLRHIRAFAVWLDGSPVTKETAAALCAMLRPMWESPVF